MFQVALKFFSVLTATCRSSIAHPWLLLLFLLFLLGYLISYLNFSRKWLDWPDSCTTATACALIHGQFWTLSHSRTPTCTHTQVCAQFRAYANANTLMHAAAHSRAGAWHMYITLIHVCMHDTEVSMCMGYRRKSLIKNCAARWFIVPIRISFSFPSYKSN